MKLIVQPDDGAAPILSAIKNAKESIEVTIFRLDRKDIEDAFRAAVARGVKVSALIAYSNRGGQKLLRELEMRFLDEGMTVARTADNLVRYHDKIMIVDRRILHVLSFNFTHLDMGHSRGFGLATQDNKFVEEATKLFDADRTRTAYTAGLPDLVVSPANARVELGTFIRRARRQLLIYDPDISDKEMIRILKERAQAGVEIHIIGQIDKRANLESTKLSRLRLHTRTIIRDRRQAFVGSQSLRAMELDQRREVGIITQDPRIVRALIDTFESDWVATRAPNKLPLKDEQKEVPKEAAQTDKVAQALAKELQPVAVAVKRVVAKAVASAGDEALLDEKVKNTVKKVVKKAVNNAVKEVVKEKKIL